MVPSVILFLVKYRSSSRRYHKPVFIGRISFVYTCLQTTKMNRKTITPYINIWFSIKTSEYNMEIYV